MSGSTPRQTPTIEEETDEEFDWEEIEVPEQPVLEITLDTRPKSAANKKNGISYAERVTRLNCHKIHTIALLGSARVRNKWINDSLLHARLLSLTPLPLQTAFGMIHKSRIPDPNQRGRMFEAAVTRLGHLRNRTFDEVQNSLSKHGYLAQPNASESLDVEALMKHALMQKGSRDVSAQLFTALLVVSLQSLPWQSKVGKPKQNYKRRPKGKGKAKEVGEEGEGDMEEVVIPTPGSNYGDSKLKQTLWQAVAVLMGNQNRLGSSDKTPVPHSTRADPTTTCPVFWTEVFSKADIRWLPVDPIRGIVNKRKVFDPSPSVSAAPHPSSTLFPHSINNPPTRRMTPMKQENRLVYVVAFEEDGYARDVTPRYARDYGAKGKQKWWEQVVCCVRRPYQLHRDDVEDEELETVQMMEGMPVTISGFKGHPLYVLTRHLKQTETIHPAPPATPELGKFRGEPVYPRSSVVSLRTSENWMRSEGRTIKSGSQPLKFVKIRAGTVNRMRELEVMKDDLKEAGSIGPSSSVAEGDMMQGYTPEVRLSYIHPNPSLMGAAHVPFKGTAKIARMLGFDYAEAVAYWEAEQDAEEKARLKREEKVIKQWTRLIHGLRIRQRLQEQYAKPKEPAEEVTRTGEQPPDPGLLHGGGFLVEADDVVQVYQLPKSQHVELPSSKEHSPVDNLDDHNSPREQLIYALQTMDVDPDAEGQENCVAISNNDTAMSVVQEQPASPSGLKLEPSGIAHSERPRPRRKRGRKSRNDSDEDFDVTSEPATSPRKRTRTKNIAPPVVPTSTRVLRSRTASAKTAT
ncbi:hypothetical protein BD779DRAFT_1500353 [Infundibulicybe gibba]|nr:hypothetical protein BD779DRAFT_1500353 [Infundibulicybe gibba]